MWWRAVLARDTRFRGRFVYAVRSTGIYCLPSCPSRMPHRKQVAFFPSPGEAEKAGYRPCRRCHPRMFEELLEKERMQEQLQIASEIQLRLRPRSAPRRKGWEITGASSSCWEIGGDYYDFLERPQDGGVILAVGDVSGKGAGAAILMSSLHALVRSQSRDGNAVSEVMSRINSYIYESTPADKFLTLFYAHLDPTSGELRYSNAGHPPPLRARASGEVAPVEGGGPPIGILAEATYAEHSIVLEPGDTLVLYTDGIRESFNPEGEEFGPERLMEIVEEGSAGSAAELHAAIEQALSRFVGRARPMDDKTLVVVKRTLLLAPLLSDPYRSLGEPTRTAA